jgi:hypothetical protein
MASTASDGRSAIGPLGNHEDALDVLVGEESGQFVVPHRVGELPTGEVVDVARGYEVTA